jgi:pimeloyl-ACP methyl ester carboxylesterase
MLQSPELHRNKILIAVDLPGYGGSDGLPIYGPHEMLEALTEYILGMRKLFLHEGRRVIIVTHDWGTLIGARLASQAGVLADHWVLTSGVIVSSAPKNYNMDASIYLRFVASPYATERSDRLYSRHSIVARLDPPAAKLRSS